jgi:hypothetical protein
MPALATVADYLADARVLLQDTYSGGYRYTDTELVAALNRGLLEMRRIRPDLFVGVAEIPLYSPSLPTTAVAMDVQYRVTLLYYIAGQATLKDDEPTQDSRATIFLNKFVAQLTAVQS